jgi:sulfur-carrier protein
VSATIRWYAAAAEAAGRAEESVEPGPVRELLAAAAERHGERLARVLAVCSVLVDGERVDRDSAALLPEGAVLDVLPPFAGG